MNHPMPLPPPSSTAVKDLRRRMGWNESVASSIAGVSLQTIIEVEADQLTLPTPAWIALLRAADELPHVSEAQAGDPMRQAGECMLQTVDVLRDMAQQLERSNTAAERAVSLLQASQKECRRWRLTTALLVLALLVALFAK